MSSAAPAEPLGDSHQQFRGPILQVLPRADTDARGFRACLCWAGLVDVLEADAVVGRTIEIETVNSRSSRRCK